MYARVCTCTTAPQTCANITVCDLDMVATPDCVQVRVPGEFGRQENTVCGILPGLPISGSGCLGNRDPWRRH